MRRREILVALAGVVAWPLAVIAQQPARPHTILWVSTEAEPDPFIAGFREGMRDRGYVEGRNLSFVLRYAPADPGALRAMLSDILATPTGSVRARANKDRLCSRTCGAVPSRGFQDG